MSLMDKTGQVASLSQGRQVSGEIMVSKCVSHDVQVKNESYKGHTQKQSNLCTSKTCIHYKLNKYQYFTSRFFYLNFTDGVMFTFQYLPVGTNVFVHGSPDTQTLETISQMCAAFKCWWKTRNIWPFGEFECNWGKTFFLNRQNSSSPHDLT